MTTRIHPTPDLATAGKSLLANAWGAVTRFARTMAEASGPAQSAREAQRLFAMSDAELARLGLSRDSILQKAFARYGYI